MAAKFKDGEKAERGKAKEKQSGEREDETNGELAEHRGRVCCRRAYLWQAEGDGPGADAGVLPQGEHVVVGGITDGHMSVGNKPTG